MKPYLADLAPVARRALSLLAGFEPPWHLSGRAALWWLSPSPEPIRQLDLVWHGAELLGAIPRQVLDLLAGAGLDAALFHGDSRRVLLAVLEGESACVVRLSAVAGPPVVPPWRAGLLTVEREREILAAALCFLLEKPDLMDLEDVGRLLRSGLSLDQGLRDARCRDPRLSPGRLAFRLARFEIEDPDRPPASLVRLRRLREWLVCEILARSIPNFPESLDSRAS